MYPWSKKLGARELDKMISNDYENLSFRLFVNEDYIVNSCIFRMIPRFILSLETVLVDIQSIIMELFDHLYDTSSRNFLNGTFQ